MIKAAPDILARIVEQKSRELREASCGRAELERRAETETPARRDFRSALTAHRRAIIAEIKQASPSKGLLVRDFDPPAIAREYEAGGAACLSVLTDQEFFRGTLGHLEAARATVRVPVLRKDFTTSEFHVIEAAAHGADAILLIAAILTERQLRDYRELAARYLMATLVEVHSEDEIDVAVASGAEIIGVNNRNLHTFEVSLATAVRLAGRIPADVIRVAESGIHSAADIAQLEAAGFHAFLVGEHLMRAGQPGSALRELLQ
jgi:indole-3-glycerol phosphate synthase